MKPYPSTIGSCKGDCQQDGRNCKTKALCQLAVAYPPIITNPGGMTIRRGIPGMAIEYVEPEPLPWYWKVAVAATATTLVIYAAVSSWAIYLAWPL